MGVPLSALDYFPLEYILRFRTKFITKVLFWRFLNIFKFLFTSNNFCTPTTIQNYHRSLKELLHQGNLVLLSKKVLIQLFLLYFGMLSRLRSVLTVERPKKTKYCHRSHKWVWHPPNFHFRLFRIHFIPT